MFPSSSSNPTPEGFRALATVAPLWFAFFAGVLAGAAPAPAQTPSGAEPGDGQLRQISLREAVALYRENGLAHRLARRRYEARAAAASQGGAYPNPAVSLFSEDLSASGDDYSETTVSLQQQLEWPGVTLARSRASERSREAARAAFRSDSLRLLAELREAYLRTARAERRAAILDEVAGVVRTAAAAAAERHEEGDISGYELRRIRLEEARMERRLAAAEIERDAARRELAGRVLPDSDTVSVATRGLPADAPPEVSRETALAAARERPSVAAAREVMEAAEADASAASLGRIPDLSLTGGYKTQSDGLDGPVLGLSLSLPLLDRESGAVGAARAHASAEALRLRLEQRAARNEVLRALDRYRSVRRRTALRDDRLLAPSRDLLEIARTAYAAGEMELVELLDGAEAYLESRTTALELRSELWSAYYELERAMGGRR